MKNPSLSTLNGINVGPINNPVQSSHYQPFMKTPHTVNKYPVNGTPLVSKPLQHLVNRPFLVNKPLQHSAKPANVQSLQNPYNQIKPNSIQAISRTSSVQDSTLQASQLPIQNPLTNQMISNQPVQNPSIISFYESILFYTCVSFVFIILILIVIILYKTKSG